MEGPAERRAVVRVDPPTLQAHPVEAAATGGAAVRQHEGREVLAQDGEPADHGQAPDVHELVDSGQPAHVGVVPDVHMPADLADVHNDDAVPDPAVVADVRVDHDETLIADGRGRALTRGPADVGVLPDLVAVADDQPAALPFEVVVVGGHTESGAGRDLIVRPDAHPVLDHGVRADPRAGADDDIAGNPRIGPDAHAGFQHRARPDDGGGMHLYRPAPLFRGQRIPAHLRPPGPVTPRLPPSPEAARPRPVH